MKRKKLRGYVIPTLYVVLILGIFISVITISNVLNKDGAENYTYVMNALLEDVTPVINTTNKEIKKPFNNDTVKISKYFYNKDDDAKKQEQSLIYYENTYMQNTGLLYASSEEFEVVAVLDGKVSNIKEDNILGMVVEIEHDSTLTTVYQSLGKLNVSVGQVVKQGDIIGVSGTNNLEKESGYSLHFEVIYNGSLMNPEEFFKLKIES